MRIAILTAETYSFLFGAWAKFLELTRQTHTVAGIWTFPDRLKGMQGLAVPLWYAQVFGAATALRLAMHAATVRRPRPGSYAALAARHGVTLQRASSPNDPAVARWVREQRIEVLLISVGDVLRSDLISAPRVAILNKHSSLLPAYRGLLPVFWTLLDGRLPVGTSVHRVDERIDHGEILVQHAYPPEQRSVLDWYARIFADMPALMVEALACLQGAPRRVVEGEREGFYRSLPTRAEARAFLASGHRLA